MTKADTQPKEKKEKKEVAKSKATGLGARLENRARSKSTLRKEIEVEVMNNTNGKLFYRCPKTNQIIEMLSYGDTEVLTIEQLNAMKNSHRKMLENFWVVIVDVYDDEVELEDVLKHLRIDKLYDGMAFDSEILDSLIKDTDFEEFKDIISEMNPQLVLRTVERMKVLSIWGQFGDMYKMNFISELINRDNLFEMNSAR